MPTIKQLPLATSIQASDLLPVSQGGTTRSLAIGSLLSSVQTAIALAPGKLLGRVSATAGGPEPLDVGLGLSMSAGALVANGADHLTLPVAATLAAGDEVIVNAGGAARRLAFGALTASFSAGLGPGASAQFGTTPGTLADGGALASTSATVARAITIGGAPLLGPQLVALVAASGGSQGDAPALGGSVNVVFVVGAGTGVMLSLQSQTTVVNRGSSALNVYPPPGGRIEAGAPNVAAQVPAGAAAVFISADSINFYAI